jgi:organic radical activating enzyme
MELLGKYQNGNYTVKIYSDGTKIRYSKNNKFVAEFPESIDLKITDYCNNCCTYCYEQSSVNGNHANLNILIFFDSLKPYTELAIGGGNPFSHPKLESFLKRCKEKKIIANITINQNHIIQYENIIKKFIDNNLINGVGISFADRKDKQSIKIIESFGNNIIWHIINGIVTKQDLKVLKNKKVLILGYKNNGNGIYHYIKYEKQIDKNFLWLNKNILKIIPLFKICSFDNLALRQLNIKNKISKKIWEEYYMGDDGQFTMYIDLVNQQYSKSSTISKSQRYPIENNIITMFSKIKE